MAGRNRRWRDPIEEDAMTDPREFTERHDADRPAPDAEQLHPDGEIEQGPETNDLGADNAVEQDTIETVQPGNPPA
jgi:hypothetical protein